MKVVIQSAPSRLGTTNSTTTRNTATIRELRSTVLSIEGRSGATARLSLPAAGPHELNVRYRAVREIVTTRRRQIQRSAMIASTNGVAVAVTG